MVRTFAAIDVGSFELELGIYEITDKGTVRSVVPVSYTHLTLPTNSRV